MISHAVYQNTQLPPPENESGPFIRLLKLGCKTSLGNNLEVFSLMQCPEYKALSYTWGDPKDPVPLRINGLDMLVTRNLHSAIKHLSITYPDQWIWIDAICINQSEDALKEREHQVRIMRDIYSKAGEVLVWLGSSPSTPSNQLDFGKKIHDLFFACKMFAGMMRISIRTVSMNGEQDYDEISNKAIDLTLQLLPFSGKDFDTLLELLRHPYWNRVWIIQEICVPKLVRIHTETSSMPWEDFKWVLIMLLRCDSHNYRGLDANIRVLSELRRAYQGVDTEYSRGLADILPAFRWSQATNKLDKVYSLLGLVDEKDRDLVKIEYNISPSMCYKRVMFQVLKQKRDLGLLMYCKAPSFVHSEMKLPSWVADWSYDASHIPPPRSGLREGNSQHSKFTVMSERYHTFQASGTSRCSDISLRHGTILLLQGMVLSPISELAPAMGMRHQLLRPVNLRGGVDLAPPLPYEDFMARNRLKLAWLTLTDRSFAMLRLFPLNTYRTGAALDVLLESYELAQSCLPQDEFLREDTAQRLFFLTLMRGQKNYKYISTRATGVFLPNSTTQLTEEFSDFLGSYRWNIPLALIRYFNLKTVLYPVYIFLLGLCYEENRGSLTWKGVFIGLLNWIIVRCDIHPWITTYGSMLLLWYGWNVGIRPLTTPPKVRLIDMLFQNVMDYRLARTDAGLMALVPYDTQVGDRIALLKGGKCPFIVRPWGAKWKLVGDAHVCGIMEGQVWNEEACREMAFV